MAKFIEQNSKNILPLIFYFCKPIKSAVKNIGEAKLKYTICSFTNTNKYATCEFRKQIINGFNLTGYKVICFFLITSLLSCVSKKAYYEIRCQKSFINSDTSLFYLPYASLDKIKNNLDSVGNQIASWKLVNIGEYKEAQTYFDIGRTSPDSLQKINPLLDSLKIKDALSFIDSISKCNAIIFINEAHHRSDHRFFILQILPILAKNGFTYFGMEAFNNSDSLISERGFPLIKSGFYTQDPIYGRVLRCAIENKFKIFGYEANSDHNTAADREQQQAENIIKNTSGDKNAKILIYGGFDHIRKDSSLSKSWGKLAMAGRYIKMTGKSVVSIDQYTFSDKMNLHPFYSHLVTNQPTVPYLKDRMFSDPYSKKGFDYYIIHPSLKKDRLSNLVDWKGKLSEKTQYLYFKKNIYTQYDGGLLLAYILKETKNYALKDLIPYDVVSIKKDLIVPLCLAKDVDYLIILKDKFGKNERCFKTK